MRRSPRPTAPSGNLIFSVTNGGSKVTEFYLLADDGLRIIGEIENIGPGLSRDLVLRAGPGEYFTACKPGMVGDGIRAAFSVTDSEEDSAPTGNDAELVEQANRSYQAYVKDQTEQLVAKTTEVRRALQERQGRRGPGPLRPARVHWERIETGRRVVRRPRPADGPARGRPRARPGVDRLAPDREGPVAASGPRATSRCPPRTGPKYADDLLANTNTLYDKTRDLTFTADQIANGSRGLLDEVATGKVTGEEEYWSRTDLWDFQANVDGARVAFDGLRPILKTKDAELDTQIDAKFVALQGLLDAQRTGDGFMYYNELSRGRGQAALGRGQRPVRAAVPAGRGGHLRFGKPWRSRR